MSVPPCSIVGRIGSSGSVTGCGGRGRVELAQSSASGGAELAQSCAIGGAELAYSRRQGCLSRRLAPAPHPPPGPRLPPPPRHRRRPPPRPATARAKRQSDARSYSNLGGQSWPTPDRRCGPYLGGGGGGGGWAPAGLGALPLVLPGGRRLRKGRAARSAAPRDSLVNGSGGKAGARSPPCGPCLRSCVFCACASCPCACPSPCCVRWERGAAMRR